MDDGLACMAYIGDDEGTFVISLLGAIFILFLILIVLFRWTEEVGSQV